MCVPRNIHREMKKVRCTRTNMHVDSDSNIYLPHTKKKLVYLYMYMRMVCMCIYIPSAPGSELSVVHKTLTRIPQTHTYLGPRKPLSSRSENTKSVSNSSFHTLLFISSFSGPKSAHIFTLHSEKADKCGKWQWQ